MDGHRAPGWTVTAGRPHGTWGLAGGETFVQAVSFCVVDPDRLGAGGGQTLHKLDDAEWKEKYRPAFVGDERWQATVDWRRINSVDKFVGWVSEGKNDNAMFNVVVVFTIHIVQPRHQSQKPPAMHMLEAHEERPYPINSQEMPSHPFPKTKAQTPPPPSHTQHKSWYSSHSPHQQPPSPTHAHAS